MELTTRLKNNVVTKCHKGPQTWRVSLDKRQKLKKIDMRTGTLNVRSLYREGSIMKGMEYISKDLVGVQEVRWDRGGAKPAGEYTFFC
jgi:hypothetical protein